MKITLKMDYSDLTGEVGLTPVFDYYTEEKFDPFYDGRGIFHDVFEHSHEFTKYFTGKNAMNVGGEIAAMGAFYYYTEVLGVYNRPYNSYRCPGEAARLTTQSMIEESIKEGHLTYGDTLESGVPKQGPVYDSELEWQIEKMWKEVKNMNFEGTDEIGKLASQQYKNSVTFRKIADLWRYGFRMAERMVPDNRENQRTLIEFIKYWDRFCENISKDELERNIDHITFDITKRSGIIKWKAVATTQNSDIVKIDPKWVPSIEDFWVFEDF